MKSVDKRQPAKLNSEPKVKQKDRNFRKNIFISF